jgi:hypothetical protein
MAPRSSSIAAECIERSPLDAPSADARLHKMEDGDFAPEFPLACAVDAGHGREDCSGRCAAPRPGPVQN